MSPTEPVFACDLTLMSAAERERLAKNSREVFAAAKEVKVLPDGYALGFPNASAQLLATIADFIAYDRLCCSFMRHGLVSEPYGGTTWLTLTGGPGVKEVITVEVINMLSPELVAAAGLAPTHDRREAAQD
jgi:hypothetical protein